MEWLSDEEGSVQNCTSAVLNALCLIFPEVLCYRKPRCSTHGHMPQKFSAGHPALGVGIKICMWVMMKSIVKNKVLQIFLRLLEAKVICITIPCLTFPCLYQVACEKIFSLWIHHTSSSFSFEFHIFPLADYIKYYQKHWLAMHIFLLAFKLSIRVAE